MSSVPPCWTGPENDYRGVASLEAGPVPPVTVIVSAAVETTAADDLIDRLAAQTGGVAEVVTVADTMEARRSGWESTRDDGVVIFLRSDAVLQSDLIERHLWWHRRAANLGVVGSAATAGGYSGSLRGFVRRRAALTLGDDAFLAVDWGVFSLWRSRLDDVTGDGVAGEIAAAWQLWNGGLFVVPEAAAGPDTPAMAYADTPPLVADLVPHVSCRPVPTPFASVPKLSWLVAVGSSEHVPLITRRLAAVPFADAELVLWGAQEALAGVASLEGASSRTRVVTGEGADTFGRAVSASSGELIAAVDARAVFGSGVISKAVDRLSSSPRSSAVRFPYRIGGTDLYRRFDDLDQLDRALGCGGAPLLTVIRRRELMKDRDALATAPGAWAGALGRARIEFLPGDVVDLGDATAPIPQRRMGPSEVVRSGLGELARMAVRSGRNSGVPSTEVVSTPPGPESRVPIDYIGFTEHFNLGDDAVLLGVQRAMPWAVIGRDQAHARVLMVGGGTLVNGKRYYLNRVLRNDSPATDRIVFGVGVRDPAFHGETEPMEEWWRFFDSSLYVGVRGPDSVDALRRLGYKGEVDIVGDPALLLEPPSGVVRRPERVVVCPVWTSGNLMGGDDRAVFTALAETISRLRSEGRDVVMLSAFPNDDRHIIDLMRAAGAPDMEYHAGYEDVDETMRLLASAGLVVAERLHAGILAAAAGTPYIGLEYWPKHRDFARSIDLEEVVVPTAGLTAEGLWGAVERLGRDGEELTARMNAAVALLRDKQHREADRLGTMLRGEQ